MLSNTKDFLTKLSNYFDLHFINSKKWGQREITREKFGNRYQFSLGSRFLLYNKVASKVAIINSGRMSSEENSGIILNGKLL